MRAQAAASRNPVRAADALVRAGRLRDALELLDGARAKDPANADIVLGLARVARRLAMPEAAAGCAAAALDLAPDSVEAVVERVIALRALAQHEEAVEMLRVRIAARPEQAELWLALANTVHEQGETEAAETFLREVLRLNPESAEARANLADLLFDRGEIKDALALHAEAVRRAPKNAQMRLNRALALLYAGDLKTGWRDYEARLEIDDRRIARRFAGKTPARWDGSPRRGRALLVMAEQGLGDQIFFASLLPLLVERDEGPVLMECEPRLVPLFARSFKPAHVHPCRPVSEGGEIHVSYDWLEKAGGAALSIELASLPRLLKPALATVPEIYAPLMADAGEAETWRRWLASLGPKPKIGICWRSGKRGGLRDLQYAPLLMWRDFIGHVDAEFVMCQYDERAEEIAALETSGRRLAIPPGLDQRSEIDRLAALLSSLDAVVSAPTVVAMLAAAVGTPTIKLTYSGSWTSFGREREPFLPASHVIRPTCAGDWAEAFQLARQALSPVLPRRE
ncbi:MAG: tetratricopeptide repeat protein [Alphaproteobacteria bacterium]